SRNYQYNTAGQVTQVTYPSQRVLPISYDTFGRLWGVGATGPNGCMGYLCGATYSSGGQVTGFTLGNGVTETFGYDSQRLEMTSQSAAKGSTTLMSLTYSYTSSAGQMGAGTTAANTGFLVGVAGTVNGAAESASYAYDDAGRLATSSQTSNGSTV